MNEETDLLEFLLPFHEDLKALQLFGDMVASGFGSAAYSLEVFELMKRAPKNSPIEGLQGDALLAEEDHRKRIVKYSEDELEAGLPYLTSISTIRLWSIFQSMTEATAVYLMTNIPSTLQQEALRKLEAPVIEFINLPPEERAALLFDLLKSKIKSTVGVGFSKTALESLGLSLNILDKIARVLIELQQSRNVLVHCNGKIDDRFIEKCPWVKCKRGDGLKISILRYEAFETAVTWYLLELDRSISMKVEAPVSREHGEVMKRLEGRITISFS